MFSLRKFLVVLLSLGALALFAACSGSDGSDGSNGTSSIIRTDNATTAQCANGGKVYTIVQNGVDQPNPQIVCNGEDGNSGGVIATYPDDSGNANCVGCHAAYVLKHVDSNPVVQRIIGTTKNDVSARADAKGGVHFYDKHGNGSDAGAEVSNCNRCHARDNRANKNTNALFGFVQSIAYGTSGNYSQNVGVASCVGCHLYDADEMYPLGHYGKTNVTAYATNANTPVDNDNISAAWAACAYCHDASAGAAIAGQHYVRGNQYFRGSLANNNISGNAGASYNLGAHARPFGRTSDASGNIIADWSANHYTICAACHNYNAVEAYNPMAGMFKDSVLEDIYEDHSIDNGSGGYTLADANGDPIVMASTPLGCPACHDPHTGGLNSKVKAVTVKSDATDDYDTSIFYTTSTVNVDDYTNITDNDTKKFVRAATTELVKYSKEFILCTSCHFVNLKAEWIGGTDNTTGMNYMVSPDGSGAGRLFPVNKFAYYLDDVYAAQVSDDKSSDADELGHHGSSYFGYFAANHFSLNGGGTVITKADRTTLVVEEVKEAVGYNIDAAADKPCTACHDPHKTTRFSNGATLASGASYTAKDTNFDNLSASYAASAHADYASLAWNRSSYGGSKSCLPCHNGRQAVEFMMRTAGGNPDNAWGQGTIADATRAMQSTLVNGQGGVTAGCGTCHNMDNSTIVAASGDSGSLANAVALTGKLRLDNTTSAFVLAAGGMYNAIDDTKGRRDNLATLLPKMFAKQKADNSLTCFTCHAGRTSVWWKATYDNGKQLTYCDNGSGVNTEYSHYAPGAGVASGLLLPKVKGATGIEPRINDEDSATWPKLSAMHSSVADGVLPRCAACHDMNKNSHSFAVYKDDAGKPVTHIVNKYDYTDTSKIASATNLFVKDNDAKAECTACHSATTTGAPQLRTAATAFSDAMYFFEEAIQVPATDGKAMQYYGSGGTIYKVWNGTAFVNDSAANSAGVWTGANGLKRYLIAMTFETLHYDYGAYAHMYVGVQDAMGEALVALYDLQNANGTGAGFDTWLGEDKMGATDSGITAATKTWLCGANGCATAYGNWK